MLGETARELRYSPDVVKADEVRLERDGIIYRLARDGVSPTALARAANVHRVLVYRIKASNYPGRLARRQRKHPE